MYGIQVNGLFIHSVIPLDSGGIGLKFADRKSTKFLKFVYIEDAEKMSSVLAWHFPHDCFFVIKL